MHSEEAKMIAKWADEMSDRLLKKFNKMYKDEMSILPDTDRNMIYHMLTVENIFCKIFCAIIESCADEDKQSKYEELLDLLSHYQVFARSNDEILDILEKKAE